MGTLYPGSRTTVQKLVVGVKYDFLGSWDPYTMRTTYTNKTVYRTISKDNTWQIGKDKWKQRQKERKRVKSDLSIRSHTVSVQCTCTMCAEWESSTHKSHSCTAQHHAHARLMPKCTVSAVTHAVSCANGNKQASTQQHTNYDTAQKLNSRTTKTTVMHPTNQYNNRIKATVQKQNISESVWVFFHWICNRVIRVTLRNRVKWNLEYRKVLYWGRRSCGLFWILGQTSIAGKLPSKQSDMWVLEVYTVQTMYAKIQYVDLCWHDSNVSDTAKSSVCMASSWGRLLCKAHRYVNLSYTVTNTSLIFISDHNFFTCGVHLLGLLWATQRRSAIQVMTSRQSWAKLRESRANNRAQLW